MTLFFFLIALTALTFALGVRHAHGKALRRGLLLANIAAAAAGAVLLTASIVLAERAQGTADVSPDLLSWAADAFSLWLRTAGIPSAAVGGTLFLASLIRHKMERARAVSGCALVWLLLLVGGAYASICTGTALDPSPWIRLCTAGLALLVTAWSIPDLARCREEKRKKIREKA